MSLPFRELFTMTMAVDKYGKNRNTPFEQRMQAIEEKLSETEWTYKQVEQVVSNKSIAILAGNVPFKTENC